MRAKIVGVTLVAIVFVAIFFTFPILQSTPIDGIAHPVTVRTSLSCPLIGFGDVYVSWAGWVGYEWSWSCHDPSDVTIPNPGHWNATQFDMIGTFSIVYVPCAANVQCNPQYQLAGTDGNSYQLIFIVSIPPECSGGCLPNQGERIEVIGTFSPYNMNCFLNGQPTSCQAIGKVVVSSWNPA